MPARTIELHHGDHPISTDRVLATRDVHGPSARFGDERLVEPDRRMLRHGPT